MGNVLVVCVFELRAPAPRITSSRNSLPERRRPLTISDRVPVFVESMPFIKNEVALIFLPCVQINKEKSYRLLLGGPNYFCLFQLGYGNNHLWYLLRVRSISHKILFKSIKFHIISLSQIKSNFIKHYSFLYESVRKRNYLL